MMLRKLPIILFITLLSGCNSNTKSTWDCPHLTTGKGNCQSIEKSDPALNNDDSGSGARISNFDYSNSAQKIEIKLIAPKLKDLKKLQEKSKAEEEGANKYSAPKSKLRTEEKIGQIWFAPYIDSEGNQHSDMIVNIVDEEARWSAQR